MARKMNMNYPVVDTEGNEEGISNRKRSKVEEIFNVVNVSRARFEDKKLDTEDKQIKSLDRF